MRNIDRLLVILGYSSLSCLIGIAAIRLPLMLLTRFGDSQPAALKGLEMFLFMTCGLLLIVMGLIIAGRSLVVIVRFHVQRRRSTSNPVNR
jgi:hypothetical protein